MILVINSIEEFVSKCSDHGIEWEKKNILELLEHKYQTKIGESVFLYDPDKII